MRQKILINLLAGVLFSGAFAVGVSAATVDVDFSKEQFVVSGEIESKKSGETVKLMVLNPDKTLEDAMGDEFADAIQYVAETVTETDGKYSFYVPVLAGEDTAGYFTFYVGNVENEENEVLKKYYSTPAYRTNIIEAINNAQASTIEQVLSESVNPLSLGFEAYDKGDSKKIAHLVYKDKEKKAYDTENYAETQKRIKEIILLNAYNEGLSTVLYGEDGTFKHQNIINIKDIDVEGVTLYDVYNNILSDNARSKVREDICGKNFENIADLHKAFAESVFVHGVKSANSEGTGHISKMLTKENAQIAGVSVSKYLSVTNKSKRGMVESKLLTKSFSTPTELVEELNKIIADSIDSQGSSGGSSGGGKSSATGTSSMVPITTGKTEDKAEEKKEYFTDLDKVEWAKEAVNYLYENKIVNGTGENTFSPDEKITREQFAVILVNAAGYELSEEGTGFADVVSGAYYEKHVLTAKAFGIVNGISKSEFGVGRTITRQDLCVMIYRAWFNGKTGNEMTFADKDNVSDYAKTAVGYLSSKGVINGFEDGTFKPDQACTRAQAAKIIYEAIKLR